MKVVEIFKSIDGEGKRAGLPVVFIRLWGCNLRCSFCDTPYSHSIDEDKVKEMSVDEVVKEVASYGINRVTLTGGEPLMHPDVEVLIESLVQSGISVNVETNGTFPVISEHGVRKWYDAWGELPEVFYTMDYKCPASGMKDKMSLENINTLSENDVLKFVVGGIVDLEAARDVLEKISSHPMVYFSPVFNTIAPSTIVDYILAHNSLHDCKVQLQMHKFIWPPEKRGV